MSQDVRRDEELATSRRAELLGLDYLDTSMTLDKQLYPEVLSVAELYNMRVVPLRVEKGRVVFGITTTTSQQTIKWLAEHFSDSRVGFAIISNTGYDDYMRLYNPPKQVVYQDIAIAKAIDNQLAATISSTLNQVRADDILAYLVNQAYKLKASDVHLENQKQEVRVRFRVDGVLHSIAKLSKEKYRQLMSSIAVAANVSTDVKDAQTGHINRTFQLATGEQVGVNLRVETVPAAHGQDVVMRLFTVKLELLRLDKLGLSENEFQVVDDIIRHPTGMVLVVGPTGSGKTTTLYSLINTLNSDERKIITLEDPVEYFLEGVVQVPVQGDQKGAEFAEKLRAVLRLDPDVVMIGEIRDQDTARTALQAALTGHLVLSTFHAGSAAAALTRLLDFVGINPLFASAIRLIMAQRLVRRLDDATKQAYQPDEGLKFRLANILKDLPQKVAKPDLANLTLYRPGTSAENPFGYHGQLAIREQLPMTPGLEQLLRLPPNEITTDMLQKKAVEEGMLTIQQDGILKAAQGLTTIEEVFRVVA